MRFTHPIDARRHPCLLLFTETKTLFSIMPIQAKPTEHYSNGKRNEKRSVPAGDPGLTCGLPTLERNRSAGQQALHVPSLFLCYFSCLTCTCKKTQTNKRRSSRQQPVTQMNQQLVLSYTLPVESKTRIHDVRVGSAQGMRDIGAGRSWAKQVADISVGPESSHPSSLPGYCKQLFRKVLRKQERR